jgi:hypothetical protein
MVVQPGVEAKSVPDAAASEAHRRDPQAIEQRDADAEVVSRFLLGEATSSGARKC